MLTKNFDFELPEELIAKTPIANRTQSRLLYVGDNSDVSHKQFIDVIDSLNSNDLLILNNTKVMKARLHGVKPTGGKVEIFIERAITANEALCFIKASKSMKPGMIILLNNHEVKIIDFNIDTGLYTVRFPEEFNIDTALDTMGKLPLPPYMDREADKVDESRYQTVYAKHLGSNAAPTAGLHFDEELIGKIKHKNIDIGEVTLHVGAGTFLPVRVDNIADHKMHTEKVIISDELIDKIKKCRNNNGKIIAVGTTSLRALEGVAAINSGKVISGEFETDIFITPGFEFKVIDKLITNFHLPKSTLLMLVSAFAGFENIMHAYKVAIKNKYRFFSYGDAMILSRKK